MSWYWAAAPRIFIHNPMRAPVRRSVDRSARGRAAIQFRDDGRRPRRGSEMCARTRMASRATSVSVLR
jgi:hypothetical protein